MERVIRPDLCVIGAGAGGLSVAAGAAQLGARVVLIEGHKMGGDCLNYGCVPSKSLIAAARRAHAMTAGARFGISPVAPVIDFARVKDHVDAVIAAIAPHDSEARFTSLGVRVLRGWGRFLSPRRVRVGETLVEARRFVIATGSRPLLPPIPGLAAAGPLTNESIFALREPPAHLLVIGGGPVGLELAQAHRRLGSAVSVFEAARPLGHEDPELAAIVLGQLRAEGIAVHEGVSIESVATSRTGPEIRLRGGARIGGSHILVAAGRAPFLERLGLDAGQIRHDARGVLVDAGLRSLSNRRVYAVGDAAGGPQFTHLAGYHATIVLRSALFGLPARARTDHVPRVTFTEPELAHVGLTEAEARARHGRRLEILRLDFAASDRARCEGDPPGLIKVMVVRGRPVGASIVGPGAGELIAIWALALSQRLGLAAIARMITPYPTLAELSKRVAGQHYAPRLFGSPLVRRAVRLVQRWWP